MAQSSNSTALFDVAAIKELKQARVAIVSTEWNESIVAALREGCLSQLNEFDVQLCYEVRVPGAVELTYACARLARLNQDPPEAIIAFGAVIRGGTPHFEYVCQSVTQGLTQLNTAGVIPVIFGVLTLDDEAQAWERLGGSHGHKGAEAALAALKMIALKRTLEMPATGWPGLIS
ncbi:MAG: 6,7-dimethyl-8-ribityllumazine synthase [Bacteroidetes bacterium]|nr:6,7-dimethyl-8-ribityllumazine synthase [Bacteroidota bacterium]